MVRVIDRNVETARKNSKYFRMEALSSEAPLPLSGQRVWCISRGGAVADGPRSRLGQGSRSGFRLVGVGPASGFNPALNPGQRAMAQDLKREMPAGPGEK